MTDFKNLADELECFPSVNVTTVVFSRDFADIGCCVIPDNKVAEIVAALRDAASQLAKAQSAQRDLDRYLPDLVKNAMLTQWNYICDETKCHPLDIEHGRGKYLTFEPKHWAQFAGDMVRQNVRDLLGPDKPHADDIGKT